MTSPAGRLAGRVALVTGAARGQGRAHAVRLAAEGADVIAVDACGPVAETVYPAATPQDLSATVACVVRAGRRAVPLQVDVRDHDGLCSAVTDAVAELGRLDIAVANAGVGKLNGAGAVADTSPDAWAGAIAINLTGVWNTVRAALPHLGSAGTGVVVLVGSSLTLRARANMTHYLAAKQGVVGLMQGLAIELGPRGIRVNCLLPGNCDTDMLQNEATYRAFLPHIETLTRADAERPGSPFHAAHLLPVPWISPEDVSNALAFLVSDEARYITGAALPVDAGFALR